jgi:hypothetical protein
MQVCWATYIEGVLSVVLNPKLYSGLKVTRLKFNTVRYLSSQSINLWARLKAWRVALTVPRLALSGHRCVPQESISSAADHMSKTCLLRGYCACVIILQCNGKAISFTRIHMV